MKTDVSLSDSVSKRQPVHTSTSQPKQIDFLKYFFEPVHPKKSIRNVTDEQTHKRRRKCSRVTKKGGAGRNKDELLKRLAKRRLRMSSWAWRLDGGRY